MQFLVVKWLKVPCFIHVDASNLDMPKWNKVDGRAFGISRSMIPSSSWMVLKILHNKGSKFIVLYQQIFAAIIMTLSMSLTQNLILL